MLRLAIRVVALSETMLEPLTLRSCPATTVMVLPPRLAPTAPVCWLARRSMVLVELKRSLSLLVSPKL